MQKLVFENSNGVTVDLTDFEKYGITDWSGLSECSMNIQSQQVPFNDGSVFLDALLQDRTLSFTVAVNDGGDLQKRYELKRELISILNPKLGEGYLYYTNDYLSRKIKCIPEVPTFPTKNMDNAGTLKASISFTACNPYWESLEEKSETLKAGEVKTIVNNGDVSAQVEIEILNWGCKNPKIFNLTNSKKLTVNKELTNPIIISTLTGEKKINETVLKPNFEIFKGGFIMYGKDGTPIVYNQNIIAQLNIDNSIEYINYFYSNLKKIIYNSMEENYYINSDEIFKTKDLLNFEQVSNKTFYTNFDYDKYRNKFIGINNNTVSISSDCIEWENVLSGNYEFICCTENLTLLIGKSSSGYIIATTSDYSEWNTYTITSISLSEINSICYAGNIEKFYISSKNETNVYCSTDGSEWEICNSELKGVITYNETSHQLCLADNLQSSVSYNGKIWETKSNEIINVDKISYSKYKNNYILIDGSYIYLSNDGLNWNLINSQVSRTPYFVKYISEKESYYGFCIDNNKINKYWIVKSNDCKNWELLNYIQLSDSGYEYLTDIIYSNELNIFCIVGVNQLGNPRTSFSYKTTDFTTFTKSIISSEDGHIEVRQGIYSDVLHKFLLGIYQTISSTELLILQSSDGENWEQLILNITGINFPMCKKIKYFEESQTYVLFTTEGIYKTVDFINFNSLLSNPIADIIFNSELNEYVACGSDGIYVSTDLISFYKISNVELDPYIICYNEELNLYCIFGDGIYVSADKIQWQKIFPLRADTIWRNNLISIGESFYIYNEDGFITFSLYQDTNLLNYLSSDSDMNFNLDVGENKLLFTYDEGYAKAKITFNEKYIGV